MPKGQVATIPVDKDVFMAIVRAKEWSLRRLGAPETMSVECSEKTLRRALNEGRIRPEYAEQIAKELDVDRDFLLGSDKLIPKTFRNAGKNNKIGYVLSRLKYFPYFRSVERDYAGSWTDVTLKGILTTFGISYEEQYGPMSLDQKYEFQKDLISAMTDAFRKHFSADAYGDDSVYRFLGMLDGLDNWYEDQLGIWDHPADDTDGSEYAPDKDDDFGAEFWNKDQPGGNE